MITSSMTVFAQQGKCIKWGNTFGVSLESGNVVRDCKLPDGRPVCCVAADTLDSSTATASIVSDGSGSSGSLSRSYSSRGIGYDYLPPLKLKREETAEIHKQNMGSGNLKGKVSCTIEKEYISSPQELRELAMAEEIESIPADAARDGSADPYVIDARRDALLKYVTSEAYIKNSTLWLRRVQYHMNAKRQGEVTTITAAAVRGNIHNTGSSSSSRGTTVDNWVDREFLSRFEFTRTCSPGSSSPSSSTGSSTSSNHNTRNRIGKSEGAIGSQQVQVHRWVEWIEPVGITARHPFGFGKCRQSYTHYGKAHPKVGRSDVDYVLLQPGGGLYRQTHHRHYRNSLHSSGAGGLIHNVQFVVKNRNALFSSSSSSSSSSSAASSRNLQQRNDTLTAGSYTTDTSSRSAYEDINEAEMSSNYKTDDTISTHTSTSSSSATSTAPASRQLRQKDKYKSNSNSNGRRSGGGSSSAAVASNYDANTGTGSGTSTTGSKHYLFDAGTSTFDSSLYWFTCGYSQRGVSFDQVYGWEMTLLEPTKYWSLVPAKWKPYWHFHNVPVAADVSHPDSPLRYIQQLARPQDFVAFKLDIDHPDMEMPIAMKLLQDPAVTALVDEFFFELHFRCEVMTSCGWGKRVPKHSHGLELVRSKVLRFFIELRQKGIRAHIWP